MPVRKRTFAIVCWSSYARPKQAARVLFRRKRSLQPCVSKEAVIAGSKL